MVSVCPRCQVALSVAGKPHCPGFSCAWLRCDCQAVVDTRTGQWFRIVVRKGKT